jgi:hypothetical protein
MTGESYTECTSLRRELARVQVRPDMPGYVRVMITWRYSGVTHYATAHVDGKPVPMFRNSVREETRPWELMTVAQFETFKRVWARND